jgi:cysteine desulfurase family protein (TIGR01976 family)
MKAETSLPATETDKVSSTADIRAQFPALMRKYAGKAVAYFDGPGGTQTPRAVAQAMTDYLFHHNANTHWNYPTSAETDAALARAREVFAHFFNASSKEIVFGNNMTTITFHVSRALGRAWGPTDEVVVTELDHHANVAPWRALEKERGVTIRTVPFDVERGELSLDKLKATLTSKTRLVAVGGASNALGTISPIREIGRLAHEAGALCYVDAVHYAAHRLIDVKELGCDFLACSPYKFYGPHAGVLFGRAEVMSALDAPKLEPASNEIPDRLETGTQNHEGIVGSAAAVDFLASLAPGESRRERLVKAMTELHRRGDELVVRLWEGLTKIKGVQCYGPPPGHPRTPTISFSVKGKTSSEVAKRLAEDGVFLSNGNFYALTVAQKYDMTKTGFVRAGCACYTTEEEVDRLIEGVKRVC